MSRLLWGLAAPLTVTAGVVALAPFLSISDEVSRGIVAGVIIAFVQSAASVAAMKLAWRSKWFYWTWGGGMLVRMLIFAATAYVTYRGVGLNFLATMVSLVVATTIFLVFESMTIFGQR